MTYEELNHLFFSSSTIHIIRMRNAPWMLPFLYHVYKEEKRFSIAEEHLIQLLSEALNNQENSLEEIEEAKIIFGEDEYSRSRKYLLNWVQKRILQDLQDTEGTIHYQLSAHTEKILQWLISLQERHHVGTESRFKLLFSSLKDIVEHTEDDRIKRLQLLKDKRAEIDKEIKALEYGVVLDSYNDIQVQERLQLFTRLCYELISDFREVEDNFKQIHRSIVEQHTVMERNKGAIVGFAFEAYDALRHSSQGKSFYAFWDFLISRAGQQEWKELTEQLIELVNVRKILADIPFLQTVKTLLLHQGRSVYDANDKMAEKLSRIISEKELSQNKRLRIQIGAVKKLILERIEEDHIIAGISLEHSSDIRLIMERKLQLEQKKASVSIKQPTSTTQQISDPERFSRFMKTTHIDKKKLWLKVERTLEQRTTATLKEVLETFPLEQGVAEVVSYYSFLRDKASHVQVIKDTTEYIPLNQMATKFLEVPYLLFSK